MAIELRSTGGRAVILPEYGGRLHQLFALIDGREEPLLFSPEDPTEYALNPFWGGSFPMAPWPNRIAGGAFPWAGKAWTVPAERNSHALHGLVLNQPWDVVARTARVVELVTTLADGWPWRGRVWQRYEITPTGLRMKLEVRSEREAFPAGCGWHPWFRRDVADAASVRVSVPAASRYVLDGQIPTGVSVAPSGASDLARGPELGERRLDDCYTALSGPVEIEWGRLRLRISIECAVPHVMVYTQPEAFCIEPQSCAPDAFNLDARGIQGTGAAFAMPGRPVSIASRWEWSVGESGYVIVSPATPASASG